MYHTSLIAAAGGIDFFHPARAWSQCQLFSADLRAAAAGRLRKLIARSRNIDMADVIEATRFADLRMDRHVWNGLILDVEEEFGFEFGPDEAGSVQASKTVRDVVEFVVCRLAQREAKALPPEDDEPRTLVLTLGQFEHGKSTLTSAVTKVLAESGLAKLVLDKPGVGVTGGAGISIAQVAYTSDKRRFRLADCPVHLDCMKNMIYGAVPMDGAVLVVSAAVGVMSETREQLRLARQIGIPNIVVYLNKVDVLSHDSVLRIRENEIRETLTHYGFAGADIPIIRGSALSALEGRDDAIGRNSILALMGAVDAHISQPQRLKDKPFLMPIEDVFPISSSVIVTGPIERGAIAVGDAAEIVGFRGTRQTVVTAVDKFRKLVDQGEAGEHVGCLLRGITRKDVERGDVLCRPGTLKPHNRFMAESYILSKQENIRDTQLTNGSQVLFYFRPKESTGKVQLSEGTRGPTRGINVTITVELNALRPLEQGRRFGIWEKEGRVPTLGAGIVTRLLA